MTSLWPPKTALCKHFGQILTDFSLLFNYNMEIIKTNHGGDCLLYSSDYFKQFSQNFPLFWSYMTSFWPQNQHFLSILDNFCSFQPFNQLYNMEITPIKPWWRLFIIVRWFLKQFFPNLITIGAMRSFWPPKSALLKHYGQIWQISAFYSTITWKLLKQTMVDIVYYTQVIILKQFSPQSSSILDLWRHFDPQNSTFYAFWKICGRFQPFTQL